MRWEVTFVRRYPSTLATSVTTEARGRDEAVSIACSLLRRRGYPLEKYRRPVARPCGGGP